MKRLRQAQLGLLVPTCIGVLFVVTLISAILLALWQTSWPAPWNSPLVLGIGFVLHAVLVVSAVSYIARRFVLDPLDRIRRMALRMADGAGRTGEQMALPIGQELQALTAALNLMSFALQEEHEMLERRVSERTARLDALNAELRAEVAGRRRVEQSLRDSELRYRGLFDHALTGIILLRLVRDTEGHPIDFVITDMNKAAETMSGVPAVSAVGRRVSQVYPDVERSVRATIVRVALGGKAVQMDSYAPPLKRHFATSVFKLQPDQVAVEFEDITDVKRAQHELAAYSQRLAATVEARTHELREAQEQLVRREKLAFLGQMAGSVGHELRNPLAVIGNAATLLSYALSEDASHAREYVEEISSQVEKSDKIIRDLLNLARTGRALRIPALAHLLVARVVSNVPLPAYVRVDIDVPDTLPPLLVDPQQIELVLSNLLLNGGEAMPNGGDLRITARQEGDRIALAISDTGYGIPPENLAKVFEPLFTTKSRGIGLGLAVCQNLVKLNEGTIELESEVGQGTTFTVWLPVQAAPG